MAELVLQVQPSLHSPALLALSWDQHSGPFLWEGGIGLLLGEPRPAYPMALRALLVTHCLCKRLQLRSAPCRGSSAPAHAFDTAAELAQCLSSARRSSPLLQPLASPASTRYPEKTASTTQSGQRDAFGIITDSHARLRPHPTAPTMLCPASA